MATCLAEILFGYGDRDHGGILFNNRIAVYENSVTKLLFERRPKYDGKAGSIAGVWIPRPDFLIESCLLMATVYGMDCPKVKDLMSKYLNVQAEDQCFDLCKLQDDELKKAYEVMEEFINSGIYVDGFGTNRRLKFIFSLFRGSSLKAQINNVLKYGIDIEILEPVFTRHFCQWSGETKEWGGLE